MAFLRLGVRLAERDAGWSMATHDGRLRETLLLRTEALDELHDRGVPTRVSVPYGLDWLRYWLRRLTESRGA